MHNKDKLGLLGISCALFLVLLTAAAYAPAIDCTGISYNGKPNSPLMFNVLFLESGPPGAYDDSYTTLEDTPLSVGAPGVLANDIGDGTLSAIIDTAPSHGVATLNEDGSFEYVPLPDFYGIDSFTYEASDGIEGSSIASVIITVDAVNDVPLANEDGYLIYEDQSLDVPAPGVLGNDWDVDGDPLTAYEATDPSHGLLTFSSDGGFTYQPYANWYGTDFFVYSVTDNTAVSNLVTVAIDVIPVNDVPLTQDDSALTDEDSSVVIDVLANDTDIDNDILHVISTTEPLHGAVEINTDGTVTYYPEANYYGFDSFTYTIDDGYGGTDTGRVTIMLNPVNDPPMAVDDTYETNQDNPLLVLAPGVLGNDSDIDHNQLTGILVESPSNGVIVFNSDGFFEYTPNPGWNGIDTFTYQAFDGTNHGNTATVTITVIPANTPPVAFDDVYVAEACGTLIVSSFGVLENDFDNEGDSLEALLIDAPLNGILTFNVNGSFTYAPDAGWYGTDTFTYQAYDGLEYSNMATVTITVVDVAPPVTTISLSGDEGKYGWYHSDVKMTLLATDDCSGVAETMYSLDGITWITYADPFVLSEPGEFTVYCYSVDLAGNLEETVTCTIKIGKPTRDFVSGTGWIWNANGEKAYFTFVVKYHRHGDLKGHTFYSFEDGKYAYLLVCTDWIGLAISDGYALMEGKCFLLRYSCETRELNCLCDYYFRIEVWDNGRGRHDIFRIQIYDETGALFHEAGFDPLGELQGGNISIHDPRPKCICKGWFKRHHWHRHHW
ncbi:MAG: tandem-95 repeat protein [Candidatus Thorarchaeota archaeon]|nr:tandem-95 repeat protein [Candidatus Thorarchaeota archaeon]